MKILGDAHIDAGFQLGSIAEWATAAVALVALLLSALAFSSSLTSAKRLSFLAFAERLQQPDAAEGRRLIYSVQSEQDAASLFVENEQEWDRANAAVNLWNTLAQYAREGLVDRKLAHRLWGDAVVEAWPHLEHFIRYRRSIGRANKWTSLVWFAETSGATISPDVRQWAN